MIEKIKKRKRPKHFGDIPKKIYSTCRTKHRYRTEKEAMNAILYVKREHGADMTYYFCDICNGYHLTSHLGNDNNPYYKEEKKDDV